MIVYGGGAAGFYGGAGLFSIITGGTINLNAGTAAVPSLTMGGDSTTGWYRISANAWAFSVSTSPALGIFGSVFRLSGTVPIGWGSGDASTSADVVLARITAASLGIQGSSTAVDATVRKQAGNAGYVEWGSLSENLTLSTGGTTTNTAANLLPANSYIEYVTAFVTTTVATATSWQLGDATIAGRFTAAQSGAQLTAGASVVGTVHADLTGTSGPRQTAATTLRVTTVGTPSAGAIRITSYYRTYTPATS